MASDAVELRLWQPLPWWYQPWRRGGRWVATINRRGVASDNGTIFRWDQVQVIPLLTVAPIAGSENLRSLLLLAFTPGAEHVHRARGVAQRLMMWRYGTLFMLVLSTLQPDERTVLATGRRLTDIPVVEEQPM
jgi:hypothetical protein